MQSLTSYARYADEQTRPAATATVHPEPDKTVSLAAAELDYTHVVTAAAGDKTEQSSSCSQASDTLRKATFKLFSDLALCTPVYRAFAVVLVLWECLQLLAFALSSSPSFPWQTMSASVSVSVVLQVACLGYYVPQTASLATAEFACVVALTWFTLVLTAMLLAVRARNSRMHEGGIISTDTLTRMLRWLLLIVCHGGFTAVLVQLMSVYRCDSASPLFGWTTCWGPGHVALALLNTLTLPLFLILSAFTLTTMFNTNPRMHDPLGRPHGRILLAIMGFKCICALIFALDKSFGTWALVVCVGLCAFATLYLHIAYLPYYWQFLNQVAAAGYAVVLWAIAPLALGVIKSGETASWVLWFGSPLAAMCGYTLASLQWQYWIGLPTFEINNVYHVELKARRYMFATDDPADVPDAAAFDHVDALMSQALKFFQSSTIVHVFVAQYLGNYRRNKHLQRGHLRVLQSVPNTNLDEVFFAEHHRRCVQDEEQATDRMNIYVRYQIEKHRAESHRLALHTRQLQVAFWAELMAKTPSASVLASIADEIWSSMQSCEHHFDTLLRLAPSSAATMREYATFLQEVANFPSKATALLQEADDAEAAQVRNQRQHVDVMLGSTAELLDMSEENLSVVTISHHTKDIGHILEVNPVCLHMFGYTRRELLGKSVNVLLAEPIASVHDQWLLAYLATGNAKMLNTTRTAFGLHRAGYIFPLVQTTRALESGFNAVQHTLNTADNFVFVTHHDLRVTAVCQRTMTQLAVSPKQIHAGKIPATAVFPEFDSVYSLHQADVAQYETLALHAHDDRTNRHEHAALTVPTDMVYNTTIHYPARPNAAITMRFQIAPLPGVTLVVVKWRPLDEPSDCHAATARSDAAFDEPEPHQSIDLPGKPESNDQALHGILTTSGGPSRRSSGEVVSHRVGFQGMDGPDDASDSDSVTHAVSATPRAGASSPTGASTGHSTSHSASKHGAATDADADADPDGGSVQSGDTSRSVAALRRKLEGAAQRSPSIMRVHRSVMLMLGSMSILLIANLIAQLVSVPGYLTSLGTVSQACDRELALQRAVMFAQDLWLHSLNAVPLPPTTWSARKQQMLSELDEFDSLHHSLYHAVSLSDKESIALYSNNALHVYVRDDHGILSEKVNFLGAGLELVSRGRLAGALSPDRFTFDDAAAFYMLTNGPTVVQQATNTSTLILQASAHDVFTRWQSAVEVGIPVAAGVAVFVTLFFMIPSILQVQRTKQATLQTFLAVPLPVLRLLRRQTEVWLENARRADDDSDDEALGGVDEADGQGLEALTEVLQAVATSTAHHRSFRLNLPARWRLMAKVLMPMNVATVLFVGILLWVYVDIDNIRKSGDEFVIAHTMQLFPYQLHQQLRFAQGTPNATVALATLASTAATLWSIQLWEHDMMFGSPVKQTDSILTHNIVATILLQDACSTPGFDRVACNNFYNGLLSSGAHAALAEFVRLSMQQTAAAQTRLQASPAWNLTRSQEWLQSPAAAASNVLIREYLTTAIHACASYVFAATSDAAEAFEVDLVAATICMLIALSALYGMFYRPLFTELDVELRRARAMILLFPEQIVRAIPAVNTMLKTMAAT